MPDKKEDVFTLRKVVERIKSNFDLCRSEYGKYHKKMKFLDAVDKSDLWKALDAKFPKYQITPDTNHVSYVKENILSSIYTVMKGASLMPTSEHDRDLIINLNVALETLWDLCDIGYYQFQAGERAALLNIGITQIGWDETLTGGNGDNFYKGNITLKNVNPLKFMRDPYATDLNTAGYCMSFDDYHKSVFLENSNYKEKFKSYVAKNEGSTVDIPNFTDKPKSNGRKDYYTLTTYWEKVEGKDGRPQVNEYHLVNNEEIIYSKENIKPGEFPFAILYCNTPADSLIGSSPCAKILANSVAKNLMSSIALTSVYKNQNPPKFVSTLAGLNIPSFIKHGDEANKTFIVNGDATRAVHYHQFPEISNMLTNMSMGLERDIETVSGVDGKYTGRDTGSIITTGGVEEMLNRVTLIDTPKILLYEKYAKELTKIILANMIEYAPRRKYFRKKPNTLEFETVEIDFPSLEADTLFNYNINIGSELPKNKQRIAAMANLLMEKQMQYQQEGSSVELITTEEWLSMMDLPNKEYMLERMGVQRTQDATAEVAQVLFQYGDLVNQGMNPNDAIMATASGLKQSRMGQMPQSAIPGAITEDQQVIQ